MTDEVSVAAPGRDLDFPRARASIGTALIRSEPEDFVVDELLDADFSGSGEHLYLLLRKRNLNTFWVARQLAEQYQVAPVAVGYAGLKDRRAVTSQWFSVATPAAANPDFSHLILNSGEQLELVSQTRHARKLRRGDHQGNRFRLRLRQLTAPREVMEQRLAAIAEEGVPNYFGEQRFGHDGGNLQTFVDRLRNGRLPKQMPKRDLVLSAARSWVFNQVLGARVRDGSWCCGDDDALRSATGPLWGRGRSPLSRDQAEQERNCLAPFEDWLYALEHAGLSQERRLLCLKPQGFSWQWLADTDLQLDFSLPPGTFATAVLRELVEYRTATWADEG